MVVATGITNLKIKTVKAIVEHITQILPTATGYCKPLLQHYLEALGTLFKHKANVERLERSIWLDVVDFILEGIDLYLTDANGESSALSRNASGTNHFSGSLAKSATSSGQTQSRQSSLSRHNIEDLFQILLLFVSAPNAPLAERHAMVADTTMRFLQSQGSHASHVHQRAFSTLNAVLSFTCIDRVSHATAVAQDAIPVISRFWQGKAVAKDEMLKLKG